MERLTHDADFGLEDWEETLFFVKSDPNGAYNILDIARFQGEAEFDEILKNIALRLAAYEDTGFTPAEVQQMRWIPVEERLPEEGKRCLLYTPCDGIICVGFYNGNDNWEHRHKWKLVTAMRSTQTLTKKVTHWMPLPQPPKEGTNGKH